MRKGICLISLIAVLGASVSFSQDPVPRDLLPFPDNDGFKIAPGYSFSASGSPSAAPAIPGDRGTRKALADLTEALEVVRKNHVAGSKVKTDVLAKSAISSMLRTLDPHSSYFDSTEFESLLDEQQSEYYGIGATIANFEKDGEVNTYVLSTQPGSPAALAGLRYGDKIIDVNGKAASGESSDVVRDLVRGPRGSVARLKIERASDLRKATVEIRRDRVPQPSIQDYYILRPGIGYIDLANGFNYTTAEEFDRAMKDLRNRGMRSLILDLRQNPGGILDQAVKVAGKFLPAGTVVVTQRGRFAVDNRVWKSNNKNPETLPLVVLVGENSASASEVVAGALQDHDRALIIGEKTFGKGLVQSVFDLPAGSGLTLTTARYYTPSGRSIQRDYSKGNLYDYFAHRSYSGTPVGPEAKTVTNRRVFGGDGIMPDEVVEDPEPGQSELTLIDPLFFFVRDAVNGRVAGIDRNLLPRNPKPGARVENDDLPVNGAAFTAFMKYLRNFEGGTDSELPGETTEFVKSRLRYNFAIAAYGTNTADQVLNENDLQTAKAIDALPRAGQLASLADRARNRRR